MPLRYLLILLLLFPFAVSAQVQQVIPTGQTYQLTYQRGGYGADSVLGVPIRDTTATFPTFRLKGRFTLRPQDNKLYYHDGTKWTAVGSGTGGGSVNSVTASPPIYSSGGTDPNITIDTTVIHTSVYNDLRYIKISDTTAKWLTQLFEGYGINITGNPKQPVVSVDTGEVATVSDIVNMVEWQDTVNYIATKADLDNLPAGGVLSVGGISPIQSSGGSTPDISLDTTIVHTSGWNNARYLWKADTATLVSTKADDEGLEALIDTKVPQTRQLTINGVTQNLTADRTWTIPGTDTTSLSNRINEKLNIVDTTGHWVPLGRLITINGVQQSLAFDRSWTIPGTDTASLSNRINEKLNTVDTTNKWVTEVYGTYPISVTAGNLPVVSLDTANWHSTGYNSGAYIQNQTAGLQDADYRIDGTGSAGRIRATDATDNGASGDAAILVSRTLGSPLTGNGHGFVDTTLFTRTNGAYAASDAKFKLVGSDFDHGVGHQNRIEVDATGYVKNLYGSWTQNAFNGSGHLGKSIGHDILTEGGSGTIDTSIGIRILSRRGTNKYSIYSESATDRLFHNGKASFPNGLRIGDNNFPSATGLDVVGDINITGAYIGGTNISTDGGLFVYNATTNRLGINTASPGYTLEVNGRSMVRSDGFFGNSSGSYNVLYINGSSGNFGALQRPSANHFALGWDASGSENTLGTQVLTWNTSGQVGIGVSSSLTARLDILGGTATAGTAPLRIRSGTALTTPLDGAMEYHNSHLYFTIGSTRYQLDQQGGGGGSGTVTDFIFTDGNGFDGTVTSSTTTPTLSLDLQADNNFVTDAEKTVIGNTSGTNTGDNIFTASDFNTSGATVSIDYANGQSASGSVNGFLSSGNFTNFTAAFNDKINSAAFSAGQLTLTQQDAGTVTATINDATTAVKGIASYGASDFDVTSGAVAIDYTNGQAASTSTKGFLTSTDWNTFNGKQGALSLTTTGTSGAATLIGNTLNIPQYSGGGGGSSPFLWTQTGDAGPNNNAAETSVIGTVSGSTSITGGTITAGKTYKIEASGLYTTNGTLNDCVVRLKYGSTTIGTANLTAAANAALPISMTNQRWFIEAIVTCRTNGASGTFRVTGKLTFTTDGAGFGSQLPYEVPIDATTTTTVNTTGTNSFDITADWQAAASGRSFIGSNSLGLQYN